VGNIFGPECVSSNVAMLDSFTFWLVILAVLLAFLCLGIALVLRVEAARRRPHERKYAAIGRAFDASTIASQLRRVRQDFAASTHHRSGSCTFYRAELVAAARQWVASFSYFRDKRRHGAEGEDRLK
jgi:hypothetical protein